MLSRKNEGGREGILLIVKANPENYKAWYYLGTVYEEMNEYLRYRCFQTPST
jgi:hypothetical protein